MPEREIEFLIIGGGDAGFSAARTLREEGAEGAIVIVSRDPDPPYDRTAVSKGYLGGDKERAETLLGDAAWYSDNNVELLTRTSAMKLDPDAHTVSLANKDVLKYGKLLLATGANVRRLRIDGSDLDGIHYLRALGILNRLFAPADLAEKTLEYATGLANGATAAIGEIKLTTYAGSEMPIADALARERAGIERLFGTADAKEGLSAFAEKRKAEFSGA